MLKTILFAATLFAAADAAQDAPPARAAQYSNATTIAAVADAIELRYVSPEAGVKIAAFIRERAKKDAYAGLSGGPLADALTRDLRVENGDRHLYVQHQPSAAGAAAPSSPSGAVRMVSGAAPGQLDAFRRRNY